MHVIALDGVYVRDEETGALVFEELGTPTRAEVLDVARRTAERVCGGPMRWLEAATTAQSARDLLARLGLARRPPPAPKPPPPGQLELPFGR